MSPLSLNNHISSPFVPNIEIEETSNGNYQFICTIDCPGPSCIQGRAFFDLVSKESSMSLTDKVQSWLATTTPEKPSGTEIETGWIIINNRNEPVDLKSDSLLDPSSSSFDKEFTSTKVVNNGVPLNFIEYKKNFITSCYELNTKVKQTSPDQGELNRLLSSSDTRDIEKNLRLQFSDNPNEEETLALPGSNHSLNGTNESSNLTTSLLAGIATVAAESDNQGYFSSKALLGAAALTAIALLGIACWRHYKKNA